MAAPLPSTSPASSIEITSAWLESIDAVYRLFEDPRWRSQHPSLAAKVEQAVRLGEQVIAELGLEHCALSFNGGKDCTVIVHILAAVLRRHFGFSKSSSSSSVPASLATSPRDSIVSLPSVYITCPSPFDTLESFIRASQVRYNLDLVTVPGDMKDGLAEYFDGGGEVGVPPLKTRREGEGAQRRREIEGRKKRGIKAIFIGTRSTDPGGDTLTPRKWTDPSWPKVERIHLILDWDYQDVWEFLRCPALGSRGQNGPLIGGGVAQHQDARQSQCRRDERTTVEDEEDGYGTAGGGEEGVPYCRLYEQGFTSLGSTFNTFPNPLLKLNGDHDGKSDGGFRPAWQLKDGTSERAGRGDKSKK